KAAPPTQPTCSSGASWSVGLLRLRQVTFDFCNQSESNVRKTSDTTNFRDGNTSRPPQLL
ncbi:MAG: hypothetical protein MST10_05560, partial [Lentisphaeria bacterium]|nr:hypothetical protein [Lentisphaeria bacterium]